MLNMLTLVSALHKCRLLVMIKLRKPYFELGMNTMYCLDNNHIVLSLTCNFLSFNVDISATTSSHILRQVSWRYVKEQQNFKEKET